MGASPEAPVGSAARARPPAAAPRRASVAVVRRVVTGVPQGPTQVARRVPAPEVPLEPTQAGRPDEAEIRAHPDRLGRGVTGVAVVAGQALSPEAAASRAPGEARWTRP